LNSYFSDEIGAFVAAGKPVIGICNGFQALVKSGILPGVPSLAMPDRPAGTGMAGATLTFNAAGHFECRWVSLQPLSHICIWTRELEDLIECPIAHGEGNFQVAGSLTGWWHRTRWRSLMSTPMARRPTGNIPITRMAPCSISRASATRKGTSWD